MTVPISGRGDIIILNYLKLISLGEVVIFYGIVLYYYAQYKL